MNIDFTAEGFNYFIPSQKVFLKFFPEVGKICCNLSTIAFVGKSDGHASFFKWSQLNAERTKKDTSRTQQYKEEHTYQSNQRKSFESLLTNS